MPPALQYTAREGYTEMLLNFTSKSLMVSLLETHLKEFKIVYVWGIRECMSTGTHRVLKMVSDPPELELRAAVSHLLRMQGANLGPL